NTVVVFVNVANERHVGPDRGWVRLARELAGHGIRSVRLDLSGVGDSPSRPGQDRDVVYAPEWLTDLPDAVRSLAPAPVVLVGLCSGAYSALECALSGSVRGVCAINPVVDIEWLATPSRLWHPERRALRVMPAPLRRLAVRHRRMAEWIWRALRQVLVWGDPAGVLAGAVRRGTDVLVVASPTDAQPFRRTLFWRRIGLPRLERTGRFRLEVVETLDHAVDRAAGRNAALIVVAAHLIDCYSIFG
ncbi:MAG TPA: alpha/beta hydrolase, partial [Solirubrobacteraceae bacterium]|nr:alpha/beta hydrolase [Solirubrobacteraceae bacterium]